MQSGFGSTLGSISSTLEDIIAAKNAPVGEANSNLEGQTSQTTTSLQNEVEQLKSALAMVSGLAKQAHKATIKERQAQAETIQNLQRRLDTHENRVPNESDE